MALTWNGPKFVAALEARSREAVAQVAASLLVRAKSESPVLTGQLRDSGHIVENPNGLETYIVFDVPWAAPVHFGNGRNTPNPFLARAVMAERSDAYKTFQTVIMAGTG